MMVLRPHREGVLQAVTALFEDDVVRKVDCGRCSAGRKGHHARAAGHGGQHVACHGHDDGPRDHATRTAIAPWETPDYYLKRANTVTVDSAISGLIGTPDRERIAPLPTPN